MGGDLPLVECVRRVVNSPSLLAMPATQLEQQHAQLLVELQVSQPLLGKLVQQQPFVMQTPAYKVWWLWCWGPLCSSSVHIRIIPPNW